MATASPNGDFIEWILFSTVAHTELNCTI